MHKRQPPDYFHNLLQTTVVLLFAACFLFMCAVMVPSGDASAADTDRYPKRVAVFVSREIKPYLQAVDALTRRLNENGRYRIKQIVFDPTDESKTDEFRKQLESDEYDLAVTVGPEASRFMVENWEEPILPVVYTMLLNPENIFGPGNHHPGVSLNISVETQINAIRITLPQAKTVGILFDPKNNEEYVRDAMAVGASRGLEVSAISVTDKASIPGALGANWHRIETLWLIPDQTVISESIAQYIIKEALLRNVPVIGYNRFFYNYGAALALILDYEKIGEQTAGIVIDRLEYGISRKMPPAYETAVNQRVLKKMGMDVGENPDNETGSP